MLRHLCVERKILAQWLKAGLLEKGQLFSTVAGTPQEVIQQSVTHCWSGAEIGMVQHTNATVPQVYLAP